MSGALVWHLLRAVADAGSDEAPFLARAIERSVSAPGSELTRSEILGLLDEASSMLPLDEALALLEEVGLVDGDGRFRLSFRLDDWSFDAETLAALVDDSDVGAALDPWALTALLRRTLDWCLEICETIATLELAGVPTFWMCRGVGEHGAPTHGPLDLAIGSMSSLDLLTLWSEATEVVGLDAAPSVLGMLERSLELQAPIGSAHVGAIHLRQFDDDFIHSFHRDRGAHPNLAATANACSAWTRLLSAPVPKDVRERTAQAAALGIDVVVQAQRADGSWALDPMPELPSNAVSIRYAVQAVADALDVPGVLEGERRLQAERALDSVAAFLLEARRTDGVSWASTLRPAGTDSPVETTALLLAVLPRLVPRLDTSLFIAATRFVRDALVEEPQRILEVAFRVPTWAGVSADYQTWELPFDAIAASAVLALPALETDDINFARAALARIVAAEKHGHWFDLGGLSLGQQRAFPSNSLINVRAIRAWLGALRAVAAPVGTNKQP